MAMAMRDEPQRLVWIVEAARLTRRSRRSLDRWVRDPGVPVWAYRTLGDSKVYVDLDELEAAMRPRVVLREGLGVAEGEG